MALELPYGYKNLDPAGSSNVDESYGYYNSLSEAYAAVPLAMRKGGRTVGIKQADGSIVEYWWENDNDLSDSGLVVKTAGGGGGAAWGSITGTIEDQTDLIEEFDKKADKDEIPDEFVPEEHDLTEFKNQSENPFARMDDLQEMIFTTDQSLYFDPITKELRANVAQTTEKFIWQSGAQEFVLSQTPSNIVFISVNGVLLVDELTQWSIDVANKTITILDTLDDDDVVNINYMYIITI